MIKLIVILQVQYFYQMFSYILFTIYVLYFITGGYSSYGGNYNNSSYNNSNNNGNSGPDWWGGWDK